MQRDGGPAGGGNPTGASFTGTAEALEIVGDHCYCAPGALAATTTETTVANFTTGNYYVVGRWQISSGLQMDNLSDTEQIGVEIKLADTTVAQLITGDSTNDSALFCNVDIVIPAYTNVKAVVVAGSNDANNFSALYFAGRIYRG